MAHRTLVTASLALPLIALAPPAAGQHAPLPESVDYLGLIANEHSSIIIDTFGSDFDTEIALFDREGNLVAQNDDFDFDEDGSLELQSAIIGPPLEPGRYHIAIAGYNSGFDDGWSVFPGTASGNLSFQVRTPHWPHPLTLTRPTLGPGDVVWASFDVRPADLADDFIALWDIDAIAEIHESFSVFVSGSGTPVLAFFDDSGALLTATGGVSGWQVISDYSHIVFVAMAPPGTVFADGLYLADWSDPISGASAARIQIGEQFIFEDRAGFATDHLFIARFAFEDRCDPVPSAGVIPEGEPDPDFFGSSPPAHPDLFNGGCNGVQPGPRMPTAAGDSVIGNTSRAELSYTDHSSNGIVFFYDEDAFDIIHTQRGDLIAALTGQAEMSMGLRPVNPDGSCGDWLWLDVLVPDDLCDGPYVMIAPDLHPGRYEVHIFPRAETALYDEIPYEIAFFNGPPLDAVDLGTIADAYVPFDIDLAGSTFDTQLGLYDANGDLIAENDDDPTGGLHSVLWDLALPPGEYAAAVIGYAVYFQNAFGIDAWRGQPGGTDSGDAVIAIADGPPFVLPVAENRGPLDHIRSVGGTRAVHAGGPRAGVRRARPERHHGVHRGLRLGRPTGRLRRAARCPRPRRHRRVRLVVHRRMPVTVEP
jgi:hypothetical protein